MEDFQGKYNGKQIEQLLDKANDIDLTKYALKTDNAPTATKLQAARTIALSGAVTGSVSSDFGSNVTISTTLANFDASKIASGTISIDRLPKAALDILTVQMDAGRELLGLVMERAFTTESLFSQMEDLGHTKGLVSSTEELCKL